MWLGTGLWVIASLNVPVIAHKPAIMVEITLLMISRTCCAQIDRDLGARIHRVRIANDRYIESTTGPHIFFEAGRAYEREHPDPRELRTRLDPNVIYMKSSRGPGGPRTPGQRKAPENSHRDTERSTD